MTRNSIVVRQCMGAALLAAVQLNFLLSGNATAHAQEYASGRLRPYIVPDQLDLPMPKWSATMQPWRAYAQTVPAVNYLRGLGIMWGSMPQSMTPDAMASLLQDAGFSRVRYELQWGAVKWDESGFAPDQQAALNASMAAFRAHKLRPLILLNAHHLRPCPIKDIRTVTLKQAAPAGAKNLELVDDLSDMPAWKTEILSVTTSRQAGPLLTSLDKSGLVKLSRPLANALPAGAKITVGTLKYLPLYPMGTPQYNETMEGWNKYVALAVDAVAKAYGSNDFDVEIWNELGFGSNFLDINNYTDGNAVPKAPKDPLRRGGSDWILASNAVDIIGKSHPGVKVIWGFSSITFFHTPIAELPPGIAGQSYHPYNAGPSCMPKAAENRLQYSADSFVPNFCLAIPEGITATFQKTESLFRLVNPIAREKKPNRSVTFDHYITEHGEAASDFGLDGVQAQRMKAKFELRAPVFWLNKGIKGFYTYQAYDDANTGFGLLSASSLQNSIVLASLKRMTREFSGATEIRSPRQLGFEYSSVQASQAAITYDKGQAALTHQDLVQVLPYQIDDSRFVIPMYVMAFGFPTDLPPESFDFKINGVRGQSVKVKLYDPLLDKDEPVSIISRSNNAITVRLALTDSVRLLKLVE